MMGFLLSKNMKSARKLLVPDSDPSVSSLGYLDVILIPCVTGLRDTGDSTAKDSPVTSHQLCLIVHWPIEAGDVVTPVEMIIKVRPWTPLHSMIPMICTFLHHASAILVSPQVHQNPAPGFAWFWWIQYCYMLKNFSLKRDSIVTIRADFQQGMESVS